MSAYILPVKKLSTHLVMDELAFNSLAELEPSTEFLGQARAKKALSFGLETNRRGYNLFVMGESGTGRISMVMRHLKNKAKLGTVQPDWVYVNNFDETREPWVIPLPAGNGKKLVADCQKMVRRLLVTIPAAFENPSYQRQKTAFDKAFDRLVESAINSVEKDANQLSFALYQDASTVSFSPVVDGKPLDDIGFANLPQVERDRMNQTIDELETKLTEALLEMPQWKRDSYEKLQELNSKTIDTAITPIINELAKEYHGLAGTQIYFKELRSHLVKMILENFDLFESLEQKNDNRLRDLLQHNFIPNLLVSNNPEQGAPVVHEAHPTFANLFGRVEYWNDGGAITTNFQHIQSGALHRANGGYLVLEAQKVFDDPYIWGQLKRALQTRELKIEPPEVEGQSIVTIGLNPHGVPLNLKIIFVGSREYYYMLQEHDPEFSELFRVLVDFDEQLDRTPETILHLARLIKTHSTAEGFAPISNDAFIALVKYSSRICGHQDKLSTRFREIFELLGEADVIRFREGYEKTESKHIVEALSEREYRHSRIRNEMQRGVVEGQILIDTEGEVVGCINGLTIWEIGSTDFGTPARITATVFPGSKGIVDIERESELGLSIHSKGVLILSGYLANRYAREFPLTISANIVMEQSYGFIDGDSASLAELCALISAITKKTISQSLAVTGSINQFGEVQAIGGVNEKIEGFFGLCRARGLTGNQGVIIPKANQLNLMLKDDVIEAVEQGLFTIYAVENVAQALELLCLPKGQALDELHSDITERLKALHDICEAMDDEAEEESQQEEAKKVEHAKEVAG
jgi:lon-related putative ATP-dependent protease